MRWFERYGAPSRSPLGGVANVRVPDHDQSSRRKGLAWTAGPRVPSALIALIVMLVSGTVFYAAIEGWSVIDSVYFCIMTLSTVGYGDLHPTTPLSKIFTMIFLIAGAGVFVGFVTRLAAQRRPYHFPDHGHHVDKESS